MAPDRPADPPEPLNAAERDELNALLALVALPTLTPREREVALVVWKATRAASPVPEHRRPLPMEALSADLEGVLRKAITIGRDLHAVEGMYLFAEIDRLRKWAADASDSIRRVVCHRPDASPAPAAAPSALAEVLTDDWIAREIGAHIEVLDYGGAALSTTRTREAIIALVQPFLSRLQRENDLYLKRIAVQMSARQDAEDLCATLQREKAELQAERDARKAEAQVWFEKWQLGLELLKAAEAERAAMREKMRKLVGKIDAILASDAYSTVFTIAAIHGCRYDGPTMETELAECKALLPAAQDATPKEPR